MNTLAGSGEPRAAPFTNTPACTHTHWRSNSSTAAQGGGRGAPASSTYVALQQVLPTVLVVIDDARVCRHVEHGLRNNQPDPVQHDTHTRTHAHTVDNPCKHAVGGDHWAGKHTPWVQWNTALSSCNQERTSRVASTRLCNPPMTFLLNPNTHSRDCTTHEQRHNARRGGSWHDDDPAAHGRGGKRRSARLRTLGRARRQARTAHSARALDKRTSAPDASAESGAPNASEAWSGPEPTEKAPVLVIATDSCDKGSEMALHNRNT